MEGSIQFVLYILAIFSPIFCFGEQAVPLIAWSNTRSFTNKPRISAGKVITREELSTNYLTSILHSKPQNIFLFVFDELSIDDVTRYSDAYNSDGQGGALSHLKKAMTESLSSLVLPSVELGDLQKELSSKVSGATVDLHNPILGSGTLDTTKTNLVVMRFDVASSDSKEEAFSNADNIMNSMVRGQRNSFTAILTATQKSVPKPPPSDRLTISRHLLQTDESSFIAFYNSKTPECSVYMTANALSLTMGSAKPITLPNSGWSFSNSSCRTDGDEQVIVNLEMKLDKDLTDLKDFKMSLTFITTPKKANSFWTVSSASFVEFAEGSETTKTYDLQTGITETPTSFSYHCSDGVFTLSPRQGRKGVTSGQLMITELQVQPSGITKKGEVPQFGPANDCVGFFTEGIWMGLFMGLILLLIFSFGLGMMSSLRVMDKFDDPKGKTITVNTSAD
ncbi:V-type proton ATPase subunit S1-like [Acanthaster planci]|uniref:V-type proton ATPase subunit S1-like n=1 Tax=Acanthaster planci TaxID=133434 RepID=A0A8B7ZGI3_ACAPL|nr:V-type proton ATPase subunit S1-like [Acanthaster planci]